MKWNGLQMRVTFWAAACLLLTAAVIIAYSAVTMQRTAELGQKDTAFIAWGYAVAVSQQHAYRAQAMLDTALDTSRTLAQTLRTIHANNTGLERDDVTDILRGILEDNPNYAGMYVAWNPNAFDGRDAEFVNQPGHDARGRFLPYWMRNRDGAVTLEALSDAQYRHIEEVCRFTDHSAQECIVNPSADPSQSASTLKISLIAPIIVENTVYGMTGVDLYLDALQSLVDNVQDLQGGAGRIIILNHDGVIVAATNEPDLAGQHYQLIQKDWEEDLQSALQSEQTFSENNEDEEHLEVFTQLHIGKIATPWLVNILIPREKIMDAADAQLRRAKRDIWRMIGIGAVCLLAAIAIQWGLSRTIVRPIKEAVVFAEELARGNLDATLRLHEKDELGVLADALRSMKEKIRSVLQETTVIIQGIESGHLNVRGNFDGVSGGWRELGAGLNNVAQAFLSPFQMTISYLDRIANGDIPPKIDPDQYQGDIVQVIENLNQCIDTMTGLASETQKLTTAAMQGHFGYRSEIERFGGAYAEIVRGMNSAIAALVGHIDRIPVAIHVIDREFAIRYINTAGAEMIGAPPETLIGQKCHACFKTSDCQTASCACAQTFVSGAIHARETSAHLQDRAMHLTHNSIPLRDQQGEMIGALEILVDQTEIKDAMASVQNQNWLRTGQAELSNVMRGEQDLPTLAKQIVAYLTAYLTAEIGALYLAQRQHDATTLQIIGSVGYTRRAHPDTQIAFGEGFAGQAALEQECLLYTDIPEEELLIKTAVGYVSPRQVVVCPFFYDGELEGVVEIGTLQEFRDAQIEFLKQAAENIAVAFHSARTRITMQALLEQTQQQAEELRMQQAHS